MFLGVGQFFIDLFILPVNSENREGAVGFVSLLFPGILPLGLIKVDEETGRAVRDQNGLCIPCKPGKYEEESKNAQNIISLCDTGEPGEFVGKIVRNHPVRDFHGYADRSATEKKLLRDVFRPGDLYFRSGDILVMDEQGWLYFRDRTGDTFRWKGENVSTAEVEAIISNNVQLADVVVYGVRVRTKKGTITKAN